MFFFLQISRYTWHVFIAIISSSLMFFTSATAHLLHAKSHYVHLSCFSCDLSGIVFNSVFAFTIQLNFSSPIWFFKKIEPYLGIILGFQGTTNVITILMAQTCFKRPYPPMKRYLQFGPSLIFWGFSIFTLLMPFIWPELDKNKEIKINYTNHINSMIVLLFGMSLLTFDIPQRFIPGKLDFIGQGHQIFHICAFLASFFHIKACYIDYVNNRDIIARSRSPPTFFYCFITFFSMLTFYLYILKCFFKMIEHNFDNQGLEVTLKNKNG